MRIFGGKWSRLPVAFGSGFSVKCTPTCMPRLKRNGGHKVFVDSSVFFAAVLSPSGGSFRIFREARARGFTLCITRYVIEEVRAGLKEKYPESLEEFHSFFVHFPVLIVADPPERIARKYLRMIHPEDLPIVAGAVAAGAVDLITLDRKHFLDNVAFKTAVPLLAIMTPGDFIQKYFL